MSPRQCNCSQRQPTTSCITVHWSRVHLGPVAQVTPVARFVYKHGCLFLEPNCFATRPDHGSNTPSRTYLGSDLNNAGALKEVGSDEGAADTAGNFKTHLHEFAEAGGVVVAARLGVAKRLQQRIGLQYLHTPTTINHSNYSQDPATPATHANYPQQPTTPIFHSNCPLKPAMAITHSNHLEQTATLVTRSN